MLKKTATIFLVSCFAFGLFFPLVSSAGEYDVSFCPAKDGKIIGNCEPPAVNKTDIIKAKATYSGLVPCGKCVNLDRKDIIATDQDHDRCDVTAREKTDYKYINCQFCHFFTMLDDIVKFMLKSIIPPIAIIVLVIGGVMFYLGGAKPDFIIKGKSLIKGVIIGIFLIYGAYMIFGTMLTIIGAADMEPIKDVFKNGIFSIDCPIQVPYKPPSSP